MYRCSRRNISWPCRRRERGLSLNECSGEYYSLCLYLSFQIYLSPSISLHLLNNFVLSLHFSKIFAPPPLSLSLSLSLNLFKFVYLSFFIFRNIFVSLSISSFFQIIISSNKNLFQIEYLCRSLSSLWLSL